MCIRDRYICKTILNYSTFWRAKINEKFVVRLFSTKNVNLTFQIGNGSRLLCLATGELGFEATVWDPLAWFVAIHLLFQHLHTKVGEKRTEKRCACMMMHLAVHMNMCVKVYSTLKMNYTHSRASATVTRWLWSAPVHHDRCKFITGTSYNRLTSIHSPRGGIVALLSNSLIVHLVWSQVLFCLTQIPHEGHV